CRSLDGLGVRNGSLSRLSSYSALKYCCWTSILSLLRSAFDATSHQVHAHYDIHCQLSQRDLCWASPGRQPAASRNPYYWHVNQLLHPNSEGATNLQSSLNHIAL